MDMNEFKNVRILSVREETGIGKQDILRAKSSSWWKNLLEKVNAKNQAATSVRLGEENWPALAGVGEAAMTSEGKLISKDLLDVHINL